MDQPTATRVLLVASEPATGFRNFAEEAQRLAFPTGETVWLPGLEQAIATKADGKTEILVLSRPAAGEVKSAAAITGIDGLPRWAIVICDDASAAPGAEFDTVAASDWNARLVAQVFRGALARLALRRENARYRGELLAIGTRVVHDLRSPLGGVLTSAEVLREVLQVESPANVSLTDSIMESVEGQMKLIRQLSFLAKSTAQTYLPEKFNMSGPFWSAAQHVEKIARTKGAAIEQPREWPEVTGSPALTEIVWQHLLTNALAHSGAAPKIATGWDRAADGIRFWLRSPAAVPPPKRAALFAPFHQLHQPNAPRGWGLPIVHRLVELQGGRCGYEATAEGGSCFFFILPVVQGQ